MTEPGKKVEFSQQEFDGRYIETRQIEAGILDALIDVWEESINNPDTIKTDDFAHRMLENDLQRRYNDWQFFYSEDEIGLNSGGAAEAFMRLIGAGILDDMPITGDLPKLSTDYGTHHTKIPNDPTDEGTISVVTYVGRKHTKPMGCIFKFTTSLNTLTSRVNQVRKEIEEARKEYGSKDFT